MSERKLVANVFGEAGTGKSTVARVMVKALSDAGFNVSLSDVDDMNQEKFDQCVKALSGTPVDIFCIQAKPKQRI